MLLFKPLKSNDPVAWAKFKKQRNIVNKALEQAKKFYYQTSFSGHKGDSRKTWQIINELTSRTSSKSSVRELRVNGQSVTNPTESAEEFNHHFATIGTKPSGEIPESASTSYHNYLTGTNKWFEFRPTTPHHVFSLLNTLDKSKAVGLDDISARLIRECADLICSPLCVIFNQSLRLGIFPDDWRNAQVTPLFKQGEQNDLNNYRPISVISVVAKLFERIA